MDSKSLFDLYLESELPDSILSMEALRFYTKPNCHLCDQVREELDDVGVAWEEVNILENVDLWIRYRHEIPVVQSIKGIWLYQDGSRMPLRQWLQR